MLTRDREIAMRVLITGASGFIGTNLIQAFRQRISEMINVDVVPPMCADHHPFWRKADITDREALSLVFREFRPTHVIHMAARTDCVETTTVEAGYRVNTEGTSNVIEAIKNTPGIERIIITSSQFVFNKGTILPQHDEDYHPITVYGQSKVESERITRRAGLPCTWTIVRPSNIWGPWHLRHRREVFSVLRKGTYFHPGKKPVMRTYGYVGNVVDQMDRILTVPRDVVHGKVLYLGDRPINILDWVNGFSRRLAGRDVRVVPRSVVYGLGLCGNVISLVTGKKFLITTSRFRSMTEDYLTPMEPTFSALGEPRYSMQEGMDETVAWLNAADHSTLSE
jgi:GlcNAc-P-P-Und epimerase